MNNRTIRLKRTLSFGGVNIKTAGDYTGDAITKEMEEELKSGSPHIEEIITGDHEAAAKAKEEEAAAAKAKEEEAAAKNKEEEAAAKAKEEEAKNKIANMNKSRK